MIWRSNLPAEVANMYLLFTLTNNPSYPPTPYTLPADEFLFLVVELGSEPSSNLQPQDWFFKTSLTIENTLLPKTVKGWAIRILHIFVELLNDTLFLLKLASWWVLPVVLQPTSWTVCGKMERGRIQNSTVQVHRASCVYGQIDLWTFQLYGNIYTHLVMFALLAITSSE